MRSPTAEATTLEKAELVRLLAHLLETPRHDHAQLWALLEVRDPPEPADHTDLFLLQLVPYASVYLGPEGMIGGEARNDIAGLWRGVGRTPPPEPDHLGRLLGLVAELWAGSDDSPHGVLHRHAADAVISEALAPWLEPWLLRVDDLGHPAYRVWADLVRQTAVEDPTRTPDLSPTDDLVDHLLAPRRSGMLLTRADLARCAADLGLGLRVGERAYALRALLEQDSVAVRDWLSEEARSWIDRLGEHTQWSERTRLSIALLTP